MFAVFLQILYKIMLWLGGNYNRIHLSTLVNVKSQFAWEWNTFPRLSYTLAHLVLLARWLCAAKWGEAWRAPIVTEDEYTRAKDPLKREQHPTVEEVYSGKTKVSIGKYNNSEIRGPSQKNNNWFLEILFRLLPAGRGREDLKLPECDWNGTELKKTPHRRSLSKTETIKNDILIHLLDEWGT